jgi:hypothetical protein
VFDGGTMQFKNTGGSWTDIITAGAGASSGGSQYAVQINDGASGFAGSTNFTFNYSTFELKIGDLASAGNDTYVSMSDAGGGIHLSALGLSTMGDYEGRGNGTYISVDDVNEIIRIQAESSIIIGDDDWLGTGNATHIEVNDDNAQISMSADNGVIIEQLATGTNIDAGADANGTLQVNVSDYRLKKNIEPIPNALDKVLHMDGVNFEWKSKNEGNDHFAGGTGKRIGLIAQDVEILLLVVLFQHLELSNLCVFPFPLQNGHYLHFYFSIQN